MEIFGLLQNLQFWPPERDSTLKDLILKGEAVGGERRKGLHIVKKQGSPIGATGGGATKEEGSTEENAVHCPPGGGYSLALLLEKTDLPPAWKDRTRK